MPRHSRASIMLQICSACRAYIQVILCAAYIAAARLSPACTPPQRACSAPPEREPCCTCLHLLVASCQRRVNPTYPPAAGFTPKNLPAVPGLEASAGARASRMAWRHRGSVHLAAPKADRPLLRLPPMAPDAMLRLTPHPPAATRWQAGHGSGGEERARCQQVQGG